LLPYITQTAAGLRDHLTIFGNDYPTPDGTCVRDYIHVVDLAKAHVRALDWVREQSARGPFNEVFNLGTGRGTSVLEAVLGFQRVTGTSLNYVIGPRRSGDVVQTYADTSKANSVLGWKAERSIDDALRDAYRWQQGLQAKV
jgi:UDP-glucose 4-epimerase